jgi:hypothetical protein
MLKCGNKANRIVLENKAGSGVMSVASSQLSVAGVWRTPSASGVRLSRVSIVTAAAAREVRVATYAT